MFRRYNLYIIWCLSKYGLSRVDLRCIYGKIHCRHLMEIVYILNTICNKCRRWVITHIFICVVKTLSILSNYVGPANSVYQVPWNQCRNWLVSWLVTSFSQKTAHWLFYYMRNNNECFLKISQGLSIFHLDHCQGILKLF